MESIECQMEVIRGHMILAELLTDHAFIYSVVRIIVETFGRLSFCIVKLRLLKQQTVFTIILTPLNIILNI